MLGVARLLGFGVFHFLHVQPGKTRKCPIRAMPSIAHENTIILRFFPLQNARGEKKKKLPRERVLSPRMLSVCVHVFLRVFELNCISCAIKAFAFWLRRLVRHGALGTHRGPFSPFFVRRFSGLVFVRFE
jgi:hypothetical protein